MSGGTIPDRGLYGVFLADSGARVGELDEEMVYEARQGEVFQLGATSWRIEQITARPRAGLAGAGRARQDAVLEGRQRRPPVRAGRGPSARPRAPAASATSTSGPPATCTTYLDDQREATGVMPDDRTIVVERFRDEIGDWRVCVLSPFGGRVHAPWALAIETRMSSAMGIEVEAIWADDGIAHPAARLRHAAAGRADRDRARRARRPR